MNALAGRRALITGGASGIGRAIASRFVDADAHVVVCDRDVEEGESAARELGDAAEFRAIDLSDAEAVDAGMRDILTGGIVDVLVNNAGTSRTVELLELNHETWDAIFAVNARASFQCLQAVSRELVRAGRPGKVINIASIAAKGYRGTSNIAYASSKGAIITMTRVASHMLASHKINVNAICPGPTKTGLMERLITPEEEAALVETMPLGRLNRPDDIAGVALFLASAAADNMTGQSLNVDNGLLFD